MEAQREILTASPGDYGLCEHVGKMASGFFNCSSKCSSEQRCLHFGNLPNRLVAVFLEVLEPLLKIVSKLLPLIAQFIGKSRAVIELQFGFPSYRSQLCLSQSQRSSLESMRFTMHSFASTFFHHFLTPKSTFDYVTFQFGVELPSVITLVRQADSSHCYFLVVPWSGGYLDSLRRGRPPASKDNSNSGSGCQQMRGIAVRKTCVYRALTRWGQ